MSNMDYELAKKLKDAGFPQKIWEFSLANYAYCSLEDCCNCELHLLHLDNDEGGYTGNDYQHREYNSVQDWIKVPTLSELIEACGESIKSIDFIRDINLVVAYSGNFTGVKGEGATPEEAMANLWLELNKQKDK